MGGRREKRIVRLGLESWPPRLVGTMSRFLSSIQEARIQVPWLRSGLRRESSRTTQAEVFSVLVDYSFRTSESLGDKDTRTDTVLKRVMRITWDAEERKEQEAEKDEEEACFHGRHRISSATMLHVKILKTTATASPRKRQVPPIGPERQEVFAT